MVFQIDSTCAPYAAVVGEVDAALLRNADEPTVGKALVVGRVVQYSQNLINDINMVHRAVQA